MGRRYRIFLEKPAAAGAEAKLRPEDAHHLARVLRLSAGARVAGFDGRGRVYEGVLTALGPGGGALRVEAVWEEPPPAPPRIVLAVALVRLEAFEWLVQKAVELGCDRFQPLVADHCSRGQGLAMARARLDRWRRIARESLKQCRRNFEMELAEPVTAREFLGRLAAEGECRWLLHPDGAPLPRLLAGMGAGPGRSDSPLAGGSPQESSIVGGAKAAGNFPVIQVESRPETVVAAIGPEGGWSDAEVRAAESAGFTRAKLGGSILRTETAALAVLTLLQARYHWRNEP